MVIAQAWQYRALSLIRAIQRGQMVCRSRSCSVKEESQNEHEADLSCRGAPHEEHRTTAAS